MGSRLAKFQISFTENGVTTSKDVVGDQFTVGRHPDNDLVFPYNQVSRQHIRVATFEDKVIILDLGSSNGTFVDGKRIPPQHHLEINPTSRIQLGAGGPIIQIELIVDEKQTNQIETHIAPSALRPGAEPQKKQAQVIPEPAMDEMSVPKVREKKRRHRHERVEDSHSNLKLDIEVKAPETPLVMTAPAPLPEKPATYQQKEKEFEKIITDARKHANKILHEAEMKAEEIAQQAHERLLETEQRAEKIFEDRMQEAHQEAERFSREAREETLKLLQESRAKAQSIRDQAQEASRAMREQTEKKCQELIALAEKQGHDIKEQRLAEADEIIEQKGVDMLRETREHVASEKAALAEKISRESKEHEDRIRRESHEHADRIARERKEHENAILTERATHEQTIKKERESHLESLASERKTHETNIARERKANSDAIEKERKHHADEMLQELKDHRERIQSLSSEIESIEKQKTGVDAQLAGSKEELELTQQKLDQLSKDVKGQEDALKALKAEEERQQKKNSEDQRKAKDELQILMAEIKKQTELRNSLTSEFEKLTALVNTLTREKEEREQEAANQLQVLKNRFDEEKDRLAKQEEERANAMKLEAVKSVQKLEKELIEDIIARKSEMAKAILLEIEATCQSLSVNKDWKNLQPELQEHIQHVLSSSKPTLEQNAESKKTVRQAFNQRRREKFYAGFAGFAMCALVLFGAQYVKDRFKDPAPLSRMVASAADARAQELKARRYNPKQSADLRDNYVDSVIYTKGFADLYTDMNYQNEWSKAATLYLLKTWRIDEDKSNRVLAMSAALVKQLKEKREAIHPDFVKKGIEQMRTLEKETLSRMKAEIGGEVRLESFKKFEKKFFEQRSLSNK